MRLLSRAQTLILTPGMLPAYVRWVFTRAVLNRQPKVRLGPTVSLRSWVGFSEYWTFRNGLPPPEQALIRRCLDGIEGAVAFDVGANIGAFTCLLSALGCRQVHAFEPIPETFCRLKANVAANRLLEKCRLNCLAVGRENGLVTFQIQANSPATNRLFSPELAHPASPPALQTVASVRLDDYCREAGVEHIDFLKIDVEGMEPYVLGGAQRLLGEKRVKAVLIEVCPTNLRAAGLSPEILYDSIIGSGYSPFALLEDGTAGCRLSVGDLKAFVLENILLLPAEDPRFCR